MHQQLAWSRERESVSRRVAVGARLVQASMLCVSECVCVVLTRKQEQERLLALLCLDLAKERRETRGVG